MQLATLKVHVLNQQMYSSSSSYLGPGLLSSIVTVIVDGIF